MKETCAAIITHYYNHWPQDEPCCNKAKYEVRVAGVTDAESPFTIKVCGTHRNYLNKSYRSLLIGTGKISDGWRRDEITRLVRKAKDDQEEAAGAE